MEKLQKFTFKEFIKGTLKEPEILARTIEQQGDVISIRAFGQNIHIIAKPEGIKHIFFGQRAQNYLKAPQAFKGIKAAFGSTGLFTLITLAERPMWKKDREALTKLFTSDKMQKYVSTMVQTTAKHLESWHSTAEKNSSVHIAKCFADMTLSNLMDTLFSGIQLDTKPVPNLILKLMSYASPLTFPYVKLFGKIPMPFYFGYRKIKNRFNDIGNQIIQQSFSDKVSDDNLIKHLAKAYGYENFNQLDKAMKQHLLDEAVTFLIAGHDTVGMTLAQTCVFLSRYPMVAEKIREEVKTVLGSNYPTYDDLQKLTYTRAVFKETLRLWPPGIGVVRLAQDDDKIDDLAIKKGDLVFIPTYATQRLKKYWSNPEGFDPERFLTPLTKDQQLLYMPFALGEHACIGGQFATMQSILVLAMLSQRYQLSLTPGCSLKRQSSWGTIHNRLNVNITMHVHQL